MKNKNLQATAKLSRDLFELKTAERVCAANNAGNSGHTEICQHAWHRRFGHAFNPR